MIRIMSVSWYSVIQLIVHRNVFTILFAILLPIALPVSYAHHDISETEEGFKRAALWSRWDIEHGQNNYPTFSFVYPASRVHTVLYRRCSMQVFEWDHKYCQKYSKLSKRIFRAFYCLSWHVIDTTQWTHVCLQRLDHVSTILAQPLNVSHHIVADVSEMIDVEWGGIWGHLNCIVVGRRVFLWRC